MFYTALQNYFTLYTYRYSTRAKIFSALGSGSIFDLQQPAGEGRKCPKSLHNITASFWVSYFYRLFTCSLDVFWVFVSTYNVSKKKKTQRRYLPDIFRRDESFHNTICGVVMHYRYTIFTHCYDVYKNCVPLCRSVHRRSAVSLKFEIELSVQKRYFIVHITIWSIGYIIGFV